MHCTVFYKVVFLLTLTQSSTEENVSMLNPHANYNKMYFKAVIQKWERLKFAIFMDDSTENVYLVSLIIDNLIVKSITH